MEHIPLHDTPAYLRWPITVPQRTGQDRDEEMEALSLEIARVLEEDPDNRLATLTVRLTGLDDLSNPHVALLYRTWKNEQVKA